MLTSFRPMLSSWQLRNFKSVAEPVELELAPLTIFAGANNSGKSTVIQSILLTAQTIQSPVFDRPVVLNGHMARLGSFQDVVSGGDEDTSVRIGFRLDFAPEDHGFTPRPLAHRRHSFLHWPYFRRRPLQIDCTYSFSVEVANGSGDVSRLNPVLECSSLNVRTRDDAESAEASVRIERSSKSVQERIKGLALSDEYELTSQGDSLVYEIGALEPQGEARRRSRLVDSRPVGATLRHFLPTQVGVVYDAVGTEVSQLVDTLTSTSMRLWHELEFDADTPPKQAVKKLLIESAHEAIRRLSTRSDKIEAEHRAISRARARRIRDQLETLTAELEEAPSWEAVAEAYRALDPGARNDLTQVLESHRSRLERAIRDGRTRRPELTFVSLPRLILDAQATVQNFFNAGVRYLGPLRDEPKALYPLAGTLDPSDVGFRGEHTAAVLDIHKSTKVEFVSPTCFDDPASGLHGERDTLFAAVLQWLDYMGVGADLDTSDQGKLGHELKVATSDATPLHDLTQVGVGVSQVLPILVASLISQRGSALVFEQPELHLHPRVQTRLADFFVSMTALGKQCIVETHSEYLINRLRYRAAAAADGEIADKVMLYFVEKHGIQSHYRPVRINEYGVIDEWPSGFFDESAEIAAATLRLGVAKRRREQDAGNESDG